MFKFNSRTHNHNTVLYIWSTSPPNACQTVHVPTKLPLTS